MTKKFVVLIMEAPLVDHMAEHLTKTDCPIARAQGADLLQKLIVLALTPRRVTGSVWVIGEEETGNEADAALLEYADAVRAGRVKTTHETVRVEREPHPPFTRGH